MTTVSRLDAVQKRLERQELLYKTFDTEAPCLAMTIEVLRLAGALVNREAFSTRRGTSDIIACYNGMFIALECKSATGSCSKQQLRFIDRVLAAGGIASEVSCMNDVIRAMRQAEAVSRKVMV